ncbi:hypothetical protein [Spirosoma sp.]|uniref:hypothetical protein n=1 Tax=Spirosoma sp. TaxID=1899569 RepID=UPI002618826F|nr:hypothetical protein [Spirosoma sp.]MCX6213718.1 hypothetical protein [Spirosoma sp.]
MYAHFDALSFYASCHISFQHALRRQPVIVLSNNDGNVRLVTRELTKRVSFGSG